jgi:hypothetical protein
MASPVEIVFDRENHADREGGEAMRAEKSAGVIPTTSIVKSG